MPPLDHHRDPTHIHGAFQEKDYDVSCCMEQVCCGYTKYKLTPEEIVVTKTCGGGCVNNTLRKPYGELSGVGVHQQCCCYAINGLGEPQLVGFCGIGQENFVREVVDELKARQF